MDEAEVVYQKKIIKMQSKDRDIEDEVTKDADITHQQKIGMVKLRMMM